MYVGYSSKVDAKCFGIWSIPHKKPVPCSSRDALERITIKAGPAWPSGRCCANSLCQAVRLDHAPQAIAPAAAPAGGPPERAPRRR